MSEILERRRALLGPNVSTFYDDPVHIVRGEGVWLWDAAGRQYLDCYNNVPHVGHCNARVVEAICNQAKTLNTHTRYLHEGILEYIEQLTDTFEDDLLTAILTCSGSEANDIALRMAEAMTGKRGIIATDAIGIGHDTGFYFWIHRYQHLILGRAVSISDGGGYLEEGRAGRCHQNGGIIRTAHHKVGRAPAVDHRITDHRVEGM